MNIASQAVIYSKLPRIGALCAGRCLAVLTLCLSVVSAEAGAPLQEARRFPHARITGSQWAQFFQETRAKRGAVVIKQEFGTRVQLRDEWAVYFFTNSHHPAHPAAVRRALVYRAGKLFIHTSGFYAGSRRQFLAWMGFFVVHDTDLQERLRVNR